MIGRRFLLAGSACAAAALSHPVRGRAAEPFTSGVPENGGIGFRVSRNGTAIGTHTLGFRQQGSALDITINADFAVGFGFITFYRYRHHGVERWRDGAFHSLKTNTNDNGTMFQVQAERAKDGIAIRATGVPDQLASADALPLTHWAMAAMRTPLFNPQTGKMLHEAAAPRGNGLVRLADGRPIEATRYALAGETPIEDWYDDAKIWAALDGIGKDGSAIRYRRL